MKSRTQNKPVITFVICCYNVDLYLDNMLPTLLEQQWTDRDNVLHIVKDDPLIEIILVNDCSTDNGNTLQKIKDYSDNYTNVKFINLEQNMGLSEARNSGLNHSNGVYISFPDPDDILCNGIIQQYFNAINSWEPDVVVAGVVERHLDKKNKIIFEKLILPDNATLKDATRIAKESVVLEDKVIFGYAWNKLFKKAIIDKNKIRFKKDLLFIEDLIFNIEIFSSSSCVTCVKTPAIVYYRRMKSSNSITANYVNNYFKLHCQRIELLKSYWLKNNALSKYALNILSQLYLRYSISSIWRNRLKESGLSNDEQIAWLENYFNLDLTKELLIDYKTDNKLYKVWLCLIKKKKTKLLLKCASFMRFIDTNFENIFIKLRTNR